MRFKHLTLVITAGYFCFCSQSSGYNNFAMIFNQIVRNKLMKSIRLTAFAAGTTGSVDRELTHVNLSCKWIMI